MALKKFSLFNPVSSHSFFKKLQSISEQEQKDLEENTSIFDSDKERIIREAEEKRQKALEEARRKEEAKKKKKKEEEEKEE
jgi:hypothetical protein